MWKDQAYQSELKKRWAELRSGVWHSKTMDAYLDSMKVYLKNAADRNFKRWPNLGKASGQNDPDPEPMKYCNQAGGGGMGMAMGGYNADTWDGEVEHLRNKMKERMAWMDQQLGFTEPANPIVTEPVIHIPTITDKKDSVIPPTMAIDYTRLSPTNYFTVNGSDLEVQTDMGGVFAIIDLKGSVLFRTRIKVGVTSMKVPAKAVNKPWIATLNGKMLSR